MYMLTLTGMGSGHMPRTL